MSSPLRRPFELSDLGIKTDLDKWASLARIVELGKEELKRKMDDAGWRARTPEGDRTVRPPRLTVRCRDCNTPLAGSAGKDAHAAETGHTLYEYMPRPDDIGPAVIDYADPTGEQSVTLTALSDDLYDFDDAWRNVQKFMRRMIDIGTKHLPSTTPAEPCCTWAGCESPVESNGSGGYRGLEQIAGVWVQRPGARPLCARHRSEARRVA